LKTNKKFLARHINTVTIILLLCLVGAAFVVMDKTAESNTVAVDIAKYQSKKESKLVLEMRLMTLMLRSLDKELEMIRKKIETNCSK
jgi:hypothetical protein